MWKTLLLGAANPKALMAAKVSGLVRKGSFRMIEKKMQAAGPVYVLVFHVFLALVLAEAEAEVEPATPRCRTDEAGDIDDDRSSHQDEESARSISRC